MQYYSTWLVFLMFWFSGADLEVRHSNTKESVLFFSIKGKHCIYLKLHRNFAVLLNPRMVFFQYYIFRLVGVYTLATWALSISLDWLDLELPAVLVWLRTNGMQVGSYFSSDSSSCQSTSGQKYILCRSI